MRYLKYIFLIVFSLQFQSCKKNTFHFYSLDKSQCISVINSGDLRYIINGNYDYLPEKDYLIIDISKVDTLGDVIGVCWRSNPPAWEMVIPNSIVVENNMSSNAFVFRTEFSKDDRGLPVGDKYSQKNCFGFDFYSEKLVPQNGDAIVK